MKIKDLIAKSILELHNNNIPSAQANAYWIISYVLKLSKSELFLKKDSIIDYNAIEKIDQLVKLRILGKPVQYISGDTNFFGITLHVGEGVLIPRPETELLVERAIALYSGDGEILDLCTGSGAIALAIASHIFNAKITAVDIDDKALFYAKKNQKKLKLNNISFTKSDLFSKLNNKTKFSLITANPPYISLKDYNKIDKVVHDYEPKIALLAEENGFAIIKRIVRQTPFFLEKTGYILCEIGGYQGDIAVNIFSQYFSKVKLIKDYNGLDRVIEAQL